VRLVSATDLRAGLLRGEAWTAPWLTATALSAGWDRVAVAGPEGTSVLRSGTWTSSIAAVADATEDPATHARGRPNPRRVIGVALAGAGLGVAVGGVASHLQSYRQGRDVLDGPSPDEELYAVRYRG